MESNILLVSIWLGSPGGEYVSGWPNPEEECEIGTPSQWVELLTLTLRNNRDPQLMCKILDGFMTAVPAAWVSNEELPQFLNDLGLLREVVVDDAQFLQHFAILGSAIEWAQRHGAGIYISA